MEPRSPANWTMSKNPPPCRRQSAECPQIPSSFLHDKHGAFSVKSPGRAIQEFLGAHGPGPEDAPTNIETPPPASVFQERTRRLRLPPEVQAS
eukprot:2789441-Pyramimonas_sp.AAC.1